jgi:hypothetical protein
MKIAIDLNDVVRDFSTNFLKYYIECYNRNFDLTDFEFWSNDMSAVFNFQSKSAMYDFMYSNYAFELYGKCGTCGRNLTQELNKWAEITVKEADVPDDIDLMFVSSKEYGLSICNSYYFISKLGTKIRETYFPTDSAEIWDKCDVLITADPNLLNIKPENKIAIKITTDYNKEAPADFTYNNLVSFLSTPDNLIKLNYDKK